MGGGAGLLLGVSPSLGLLDSVGGSVSLVALLVSAEDVAGDRHSGILNNIRAVQGSRDMHGAEQLTGVAALLSAGVSFAGVLVPSATYMNRPLTYWSLLPLVFTWSVATGFQLGLRVKYGVLARAFSAPVSNCVLHIDEHIGAIGILADADVGVLIDGGAGNHLGAIGPFGLEQITIH